MPSCLGLYIEKNLIKYAKVSKNNETIKVDSFGIKFYENIENTIKQIIEETYSFKIPISINTDDEWYNKFQVFSLLTKKDMDDAIKTEFENVCYEKDINKNLYEQRYIFTNSYRGDERIPAIHISVPKTYIEERKNHFLDYKVNSIVPIGVCVANLIKTEKKGSVMIVNIEKNTTITKIVNGTVSNVEILEYGAQEILEKITKKENSYSKAYEICKSSTIYTETDKDLQYEENEYLEDIMPTLFEIVSKVRNDINESIENIDKVYITGSGAIINNVDIYFQDYLKGVKCEILKPSFVKDNLKINIKDYIEVNSAISIALQGLEKNKNINFKNETGMDKVISILNSDISSVRTTDATKTVSNFLEKFGRQFDMLSMTIILIIIVYIIGSNVIFKQLEEKIAEADTSINNTNMQIEEIKNDEKKLNLNISNYESLIHYIENLNNMDSEDKRYKNTIPNLLNKIMTVVPKGVQVLSIENSSGEHIAIKVKSRKFQEMAFFKTKLKEEEILRNVVSDTGTSVIEKVNDKEIPYLIVNIEGDLP